MFIPDLADIIVIPVVRLSVSVVQMRAFARGITQTIFPTE